MQHPKIYSDRVKGYIEMLETPVQCAFCNMCVTFIDDDILLGSKPYNRPLFVTGFIKEQKVSYILVDDGQSSISCQSPQCMT